ncbi:phosphotransferase [Novosphingobium sp. BL-52-GroH]|uniref:phosphotransferase family protein n=1 Tax=Novosphingobium sp. BL-52-GroH TaxID=3349877 RepID=UPI00384E3858
MAEIEASVRKFVADKVPGASVSGIRPLGGGASKEQYRFDLAGPGISQSYVLRREPPESIVETHRLREFQIMNAMRGVVPVPEVPWVDPQGAYFGRPSLVSAFVSGVTKPAASTSNVSGLGTEFGPDLRAALGPQFVEILARIHMFDWRAAPLDAFYKPAAGTTDGVHSIINWWDRIWEEDSFEAVPVMRLAAHWLRANAPVIDQVTIVHHDYRAGNFLFDPDTAQITAVLDWELAHLGDYHEDLAWTLQEGYGYYDDEGRFYVCGLIERSEFLRRYQDITGFAIDEARLAYYGVMNAWKSTMIVIATGIRCLIGGKSHQDVLLSWIASFGNVTLATLNRLLRKEMGHGA